MFRSDIGCSTTIIIPIMLISASGNALRAKPLTQALVRNLPNISRHLDSLSLVCSFIPPDLYRMDPSHVGLIVKIMNSVVRITF